MVRLESERDLQMRHLLHHEEGDVGVAFCGFRNPVLEVLPYGASECVVCDELWQAHGWSWEP